MMERRFIIGIIIVSIVVTVAAVILQSVSYQESYEMDIREPGPELEVGMEEASQAAGLPGISFKARTPQEQKVIKTSYISLEVTDFYEAADTLGDLAEKYRGYTSNVSAQKYEGRIIGTVTIRVPAEHFEDIVQDIGEIGELKEQNISLEDVTEEYIDLTARLENLKRQEERYREILDMATTVEDVLKVETQLERIRGDIESFQGRLNYLDNKIQYSVVQVQISEPETIVHEAKIRQAFSRAVDGFLATIRGIIVFLGYFIPIAIFLIVLGLVGKYVYQRWFKE
ncbi:MAG: DUF4349 domain-containing protein [Candidatus Methanofastidiosia archaeon]|jgi:hypothetical protein